MTLRFVLAAAAFVAFVALVVRQVVQSTLKRNPCAAAEAAIEEVLGHYTQQIVGYRNCIIRRAGAVRHVDLYLVVPGQMTLRRAQHLRRVISDQMDHRLGGCSLLVHIEPCLLDCSSCSKQEEQRQCSLHPEEPVAVPAAFEACPYRQ
jgi:divalent metal cation (Fe/Co/Zn/Cd) transporter